MPGPRLTIGEQETVVAIGNVEPEGVIQENVLRSDSERASHEATPQTL